MSSFSWSAAGSGSGSGVTTYANLAAFPIASSQAPGALGIALDTGVMYENISNTWVAIAGAGTVLSIGTPANGLLLVANVLTIDLADATHTGALSSTDWNTFNNKANNTLNNLGITAINANLLPNTANTINVGTQALPFAQVNANSVSAYGFTGNDGVFYAASAASTADVNLTPSDSPQVFGSLSGKTALYTGPSLILSSNTQLNLYGGSGGISQEVDVTGGVWAVNVGATEQLRISNAAGIKASATLDMNTHLIRNVVDPSLAQDAATKNYVDTTTQPPGSYITSLTGPITASGPGAAAVSITSQTGAGTTFVMQDSPTLTTPNIGAATGTSLNLSGLTASQAVVTDASKNLVSLAYTTTPTASALVQRDASGNAYANNFASAFQSIVSAGGTTTLSASSPRLNALTGTQNQTFKLPVGNSLVAGATFEFNNNSTGSLIVNDNSNTLIVTVPTGGFVRLYLTAAGSPGTWDYHWGIPSQVSWGNAALTLGGSTTLNVPGTITNGALTASQAVVTDGSKNLVSLAYATASTATTLCERDSNANITTNNFISGYATTATAAGTTTLTVSSAQQQYFTGTTTQTVQMPVTSTLVTGMKWFIINNSTGVVTVNSSGSNQIIQLAANSGALITCIGTSLTTAADWSASLLGAGGANTPTVQKFTSGSGTYTTPANVTYIRVRMVGGGGQGGGSGAGAPTAGGNGGDTTFGSSLLTAGGGIGGGPGSTTSGGAGGTATLNSPAIGTAMHGSAGAGGGYQNSLASNAFLTPGGVGGASPFGGAGAVSGIQIGGAAAETNSGSGGQGGAVGPATNDGAGGGGGAGGYIDAIIANPSSTYAYAVGAGGNGAGAAGTTGYAGGNGAAGYIEVTEYYANGAIGTATNVTGVVAVANGGTGASTASSGWANLLQAAAKSDQVTGSSTTLAVTPSTQQYHKSAAKVWCLFTQAGSNTASYNVSSITNNATSDNTINFTVSFTSSSYACAGITGLNTTSQRVLVQPANSFGRNTGSVRLQQVASDGVLNASSGCDAGVVIFGDQ